MTATDFRPVGAASPLALAPRRYVLAEAGPYAAVAVQHAAETSGEVREVAAGTLPEALADLAGPAQVVVVAAPETLRFDTVELLNETAAERGLELGFLTGRDPGRCAAFAARAHGGARRSGRASIDPTRGVAEMAGPEGRRSDVPVPDLLARDWRVLCLSGHGDGSHLNLRAAVVCGRVDDVETTADGRPVERGCRAGAPPVCKKVRTPGATPLVLAGLLRADLLVLLSCNSFSLAREMYPSTASIAVAASEGLVGGVVGTTRQTAVDERLAAVVDAMLRVGRPAGEVVAAMNDHMLRRGLVPCWALLGDPAATYPGGGDPGLRFDEVRVDPPAGVVEVAGRGAALRGTRATVVAHSGSARLVDVTETVDRTLANLRDLRVRLSDAEAVERAVRMYASDLGGLTEDLQRRLRSLATYRQAAGSAAWLGIAATYQSSASGQPHRVLADALGTARQSLAAWTDEAALLTAEWSIEESIAGSAIGEHFYPSLHMFHRQVSVDVDPRPCGKCGGRLRVRQYDGADLGLAPRYAVDCAVCGPVAEASDRLALDVTATTDRRRPGLVDLEFRLRGGAVRHGSSGHVVFQVRDRSNTRADVAEHVVLPPGQANRRVEIRLAEGGSDLWWVRCAALRDGSIAYARRVVTPFGLPA